MQDRVTLSIVRQIAWANIPLSQAMLLIMLAVGPPRDAAGEDRQLDQVPLPPTS